MATNEQNEPPSIRHLRALVDVAEAEDRHSPARCRQLRMTLAQLERCLAADVLPEEAREDVRELLSPEGIDAFLDTAAAGRWRAPRKGQRRRRLSWSSLATLRDCLKILGEEAGLPPLVLPRVWRERQHLKPVVKPAQQEVLYRQLADLAARKPAGLADVSLRELVQARMRVRLLAMVGVVLDTGARSVELRRMRVDDLGDGLETLRVFRAPQNASHLPDVMEVYRLREATRAALRWWLGVREELVAPLEGAKTALWVAVWPGAGDPVPGLPLRHDGVEQAYSNGVAALNVEMAGGWDVAEFGPWVPLPRRMEQLRRGVVAEPLERVVEGVTGEFPV